MNDHVKNQHYVPQFLLRNFASKKRKFIWAYDKRSISGQPIPVKERPIRKVASQNFFYDLKENSKEGSHEYALQKIEDEAAPIVSKIISTRNLRKLTEIEREKLSLFVISQNFRTKGHLIQTEILNNELNTKIESALNRKIPDLDTRILWLEFLENTPLFSHSIRNKKWGLAQSDNKFYISDNPVVLQNTTDQSKIRGTLGIDSYGIEIYLPLSPSLVLCFFCDKFFAEKGYGENYIDNIKCNEEHITNLNSLQTVFAERFIFSAKNDFRFVADILGKGIQ